MVLDCRLMNQYVGEICEARKLLPPSSGDEAVTAVAAANLACAGLMECMGNLSRICYEMSPESWPANFLSSLAIINVRFAASHPHPMTWIRVLDESYRSAVNEWYEATGGADPPIN